MSCCFLIRRSKKSRARKMPSVPASTELTIVAICLTCNVGYSTAMMPMGRKTKRYSSARRTVSARGHVEGLPPSAFSNSTWCLHHFQHTTAIFHTPEQLIRIREKKFLTLLRMHILQGKQSSFPDTFHHTVEKERKTWYNKSYAAQISNASSILVIEQANASHPHLFAREKFLGCKLRQ
ncbi:hypothetical protein FB567DRAFT_513828 [Paraphoma chrysanthemicola]|uniref:Uncharacterized protein n=1 Tax=Paraphoma chrysanthemicola TaxID=798071 RepID=A0A8K0W5I3_9PLEO|nr:hypothetical protein FB567DRAFT_513828 [Paraphoma chrysanthemicola]